MFLALGYFQPNNSSKTNVTIVDSSAAVVIKRVLNFEMGALMNSERMNGLLAMRQNPHNLTCCYPLEPLALSGWLRGRVDLQSWISA